MSEKSFEFEPLHGSMFAGTADWAGNWSEQGGDGSHAVRLKMEGKQPVIEFRKYGASKWSRCEVELSDSTHPSLRGHVTFKGNVLNIWLNYSKGHEGDSDYARYDLKPRAPKIEPLI
jgi:hypothetical protein